MEKSTGFLSCADTTSIPAPSQPARCLIRINLTPLGAAPVDVTLTTPPRGEKNTMSLAPAQEMFSAGTESIVSTPLGVALACFPEQTVVKKNKIKYVYGAALLMQRGAPTGSRSLTLGAARLREAGDTLHLASRRPLRTRRYKTALIAPPIHFRR